MKKVVKFGGSSLASADQFKKVGNIIRADLERKFVVPSAPGKRYSSDTKVTDMLYGCYDLADKDKDFSAELNAIKARYQEIIDGLELDLSLEDEFAVLEKNFKEKAGKDYAASRGEYLNGIIMAAYLGYEFVDAAEVIRFYENGEFDAVTTNKLMTERLAQYERAVVPGFYGAKPDGKVKTFSRGGSDVTGSIVAKAVKADVYENWTDVSGFLLADPRIINNPVAIETITYRELRELAYMGASVLHEDAIFPVRQEGIPINIRNTNAPEDNGTWIVGSTCQKSKHVITGIAGKKGTTGSIIKLVCSLFLSFSVIRPIAQIRVEEFSLYSSGILDRSEEAAAIGKEISDDAISRIIKQETQAYILDKAASLGADIDAEVILSSGEPPVPTEIYIKGTITPYAKTRLQSILSGDLGIAKENQIWIP